MATAAALSGLAPPAPAATAPPVLNPGALARLAVRTLEREALLTPKPGLVDRRGGGAHTDMDVSMLLVSARALAPAFTAIACAARARPVPGSVLRAEVGALGRRGEQRMLAATGGVNTHRGALWALGLLVAGAAAVPAGRVDQVCAFAGALARIPDPAAPAPPAPSNGQQACARYGAAGARGQAQAGFPAVLQAALPRLRASRAVGKAGPAAQLDALLALMAGLTDTCLLHRGGRQGLALAQAGARAVLRAGGAGTPAGDELLLRLDRRLCLERLSPGGSADLLAAALFLDSLDRRSGPARPDPAPEVPCSS